MFEVNFAAIKEYAENPKSFRDLDLLEQLDIVAEIILYYAQLKTAALKAAGKTRTDQCVEAREWQNLEEFWQNEQTNLRNKVTLLQRGIS